MYALCHQFLNYVFTAAWLSVCYMYSAIFLLIFLVSSALKMSYIYSNYFPMTCWSAICTTPSATWGGGREMHFNNENFKKTSICSSEFGWFRFFFNSVRLSKWGRKHYSSQWKCMGNISLIEPEQDNVNMKQGILKQLAMVDSPSLKWSFTGVHSKSTI